MSSRIATFFLLVCIASASGKLQYPPALKSDDGLCSCPILVLPSPSMDVPEPELPIQTLPTTNPFPTAEPLPDATPALPTPTTRPEKSPNAHVFQFRIVYVFRKRCELRCEALTCQYCRCSRATGGVTWGECYSHRRSILIDTFYRKHGGRLGFSVADAVGWNDGEGLLVSGE